MIKYYNRCFIKKFILFGIIFIIIFLGCDEGLAPKQLKQKSFLTGKLTFVGGKDSWPTDSMLALRVAAFKVYPFTGTYGIMEEIISGRAYFTQESLPLYVDSDTFSIEITNPPVMLKYIGVARQLDSNIFNQQVVGVYTESGNKTIPSTLLIEEGKTYNISIEVDFKNLPPQPNDSTTFKGKKNGTK